MTSKIRALGVVVVLGFILSLGIALLTFSYSEVGLTSEIESLSAPACDISTVPQSVVENATEKAMELFGDYQEKCDDFVNQLLTLYLEAKGKDFVIVFNAGGWGWSLAEASPDWWSILGGIKSELDTLGYKSLLLDYRRTGETLRARLNEAVEMIAHYPSKARGLAARVRFLTDNIPDLRVIVAGESTGTVISESVMSILKDNSQVFSIQSGPPFWHKNLVLDRTLLITNNGLNPDSFSQGDFFAMMLGNVKALLGVSKPEDDSGRI